MIKSLKSFFQRGTCQKNNPHRLEEKFSNEKKDPGSFRAILFLDIDGVLHTFEEMYIGEVLNPKRIKMLTKWVAKNDIGIVISSTWREGHSLASLREQLGGLGPYVVDTTGSIHPDRGLEIHQWLTDNEWTQSYVIFDDTDYGISSRHGEKFIKVDRRFALEQKHLDAGEGALFFSRLKQSKTA